MTEKRKICKKTRTYNLKTNKVLHFEPKLHLTFQHVSRQDPSQRIKSGHKNLLVQNSDTAIEDKGVGVGTNDRAEKMQNKLFKCRATLFL